MHSARFVVRQIPVDLLDLPPVGKILAQPDADINGEENAQIGQRSPQIQSAPSQQQRHHPERGRCDAKVRGGGSEQTPRLHLPDDRTSGKDRPHQSGQEKLHRRSGDLRAEPGGAVRRTRKIFPKANGKDQKNPIADADPQRKAQSTAQQNLFFHEKTPCSSIDLM